MYLRSRFSSCRNIFFSILLFLTANIDAVEPTEENSGANHQAIINGEIADTGSQDWMASLLRAPSVSSRDRRKFCGGTLVDKNWILTAAHCVVDEKASSIEIWLGGGNINDDSAGELKSVAQIITHPYYYGGFNYDIALLRLSSPAQTTPILLINQYLETLLYGTELTLFGRGVNSWIPDRNCELFAESSIENPDDYSCKTFVYTPGTSTPELMKTNLTLHTQTECENRVIQYLESIGITDYPTESSAYDAISLCLWEENTDSSGCYGDSGGPVTGNLYGITYLVGVINGGMSDNCSSEYQITVASRTISHLWFIYEYMNTLQSMSFDSFCPEPPKFTLSYIPADEGKSEVIVSWDKDPGAVGYTLFYSKNPIKNDHVGKLKLTADKDDFHIILNSGARFLVSLRTRYEFCESPMSELQAVLVP